MQFSRPARRVFKSVRSRFFVFAILIAISALHVAVPFAPSASSAAPETKANYSLSRANEQTLNAKARSDYGKLPIAFEANQGQIDEAVRFIARGRGYALRLMDDRAVLTLSASGDQAQPTNQQTLSMRMKDSQHARIVALDQLPGAANYFVGSDAKQWRTNIPTFRRVVYETVYPGIDLVYYGNQQQLEYDFNVSPGANPNAIRLLIDGANRIRMNARGDVLLKTQGGTVTLRKPVSYQLVDGKKQKVTSKYFLSSKNEIGFRVGRYDRSRPLVIDPVLIYSTYLGGNSFDQANAIAVDSAGSAYITGSTISTNFPLLNPFQSAKAAVADVFVTKLNPSGSSIVYSTYLGGNSSDTANAVTIDAAGNAYVAGQTISSDFPLVSPVQGTLRNSPDAFVAKLSNTGSSLLYSTFLGGSSSDIANAIAVDPTGNAIVTGSTLSRDFPTLNPLQAARGGNALFKTTNGASLWIPSDSGIVAGIVSDVSLDPNNSSTIYASADTGLFKSVNGGGSWTAIAQGQIPNAINRVVVDPSNSSIVYTAGNGGAFKSIDGGATFTPINNGISPTFLVTLAIDPINPNKLYASGIGGLIFRTADGGANWTAGFISNVNGIPAFATDPNVTGVVYAATNRGVFKSVDSGAWSGVNNGMPFSTSVNAIAIDKTNNLVYAATGNGLFKTADAGANWSLISSGIPFVAATRVALDATNSSVIYAVGSGTGLFKTSDGGANWTAAGNGLQTNNGVQINTVNSLVIDPSVPSTLYLGTATTSDVFVTKLSSSGNSLTYSTYLGGNSTDSGNGIAVDASGNAFVAGTTASAEFPVINAFQSVKREFQDAFVSKISASGSNLMYSTFLGGGGSDLATSIAIDGSGNAYVGGTTFSNSFPTMNAFQNTLGAGSFNDCFITKFAPTGSALIFSTYLGGNGDDQCRAIAVDASGQAAVTGSTLSTNFPILRAQQPTKSGFATDAFVSKLAANGSALVSSTYLGGFNADVGRGIGVDSAGAMYVSGTTSSNDFPTNNTLQPWGGSDDAFVAKIGPTVELGVTISDAPDPVAFGSNLTYTINVTNNGELPATGVTLTQNLPAGSMVVSSNSTIGSCSGSGPIVCAIGTLNSDQTAVITVVTKPPATRSISSTATVTLNEVDPITINNSATATTLIDFADLSVSKKVTSNRVAPGSKIIYVMTVTNHSGAAVSQSTLTDTLPSDVTFVSCNIPGINGSCSAQGNVVTASFFTLGPGNFDLVFLTVQLNNSVSTGSVVTNTATINSSLVDPNPQNNSSTSEFTVVTNPIIQKSNGKIAWASDRFSPPLQPFEGIYLMNSDGTGETFFPNIQVDSRLPVWSRDGSRLAYTKTDFSGSGSRVELFAIGVDGTGAIKLATNASGFSGSMSWSPSGNQVAYIASESAFPPFTNAVFIANTDGSGALPLPNSPNLLRSVDWSPDGTKFVYANASSIFSMSVDATQQTQLTTPQQTPSGQTVDSSPRWSPDGSKILFTRSVGGVGELYMMNADGTNQTRLFNHGGQDGQWSPDGQSIVFAFLSEIHRVNLDGTNFTRLTNDNFFDLTPDWQPIANPNPTPTPTPAPVFSLSGQINGFQPGGFGSVRLSGPVNAFTNVFAAGNFSFIRLPAGQYTITPESVGDYTFNPTSRTITISNADVTNVDFTATFVPPKITGRVTDLNGQPLANIKISGLGQFPLGDVFTDVNGFYAFNNAAQNQSYTVRPDSSGQYLFEPESHFIFGLRGEQVRNFVGTAKPANRIRGQVLEAITGNSIVGVQVNLSQDGVPVATTTTEPGGIFSFTRPSNHSYVITIPFTQTYTFEPSVAGPPAIGQITIPNLTTDQFVNFTGARRNTFQFSSSGLSFSEGSVQAQITVTRTGDIVSPAIVSFGTLDDPAAIRCDTINGTAYARCDYATKVGTLNFGAHETTKSFMISLVDDAFAEGNETFNIGLSSPIGATLGTQATTTVTITDNDNVNGPNPIFTSPFFVRQHYLDFLSREPDPGGFAAWMNVLNNCSDVNNNPTCDRVTVSGSFFGSQEFQLKGYFVFRFYRLAFDRLPEYAELTPDMSAVTGETQSEVFQKKAAFVNAFVLRPEFVNTYASMTNEQFLDALFNRYNLTQITTFPPSSPDQGTKVTFTKSELLSFMLPGPGQLTRARVLRAVADSDQVFNAEFNRAFVAMQYYGYLRRTPESGGFNAWLNYLNANPTDFRTMINGFMNSTEYRLRFGPPQ